MATKTRQIDVATATADAEGVAAGDLRITLSPAGRTNIEGIFKEAQNTCTVASEFGTCAIQVIKRGLDGAPEVTAGLESGIGSGTATKDVGGFANLVEWLGAAEGAVLAATNIETAARAPVALVMTALRAFMGLESFPIISLALVVMFTTWVAVKTMPVETKIPKWMNTPHLPPTSVSTTSSRVYSTVHFSAMTDYYHAIHTPFNEPMAGAAANALVIRFSSMEARVTSAPKPKTCIKRIIKGLFCRT